MGAHAGILSQHRFPAGALRDTICITMRFEWDPEKDAANQIKHGSIAFSSAALVFNDPCVMFRKDRVIDGEQRWHAIGVAESALLLVVHVYRGKRKWRRSHPHHLGPPS